MSFAEKGEVADIDPAFFVGYLHRLKATGTLKFEDGSIQRAIYFRDGRVLFSSSNAPEDQLGAILVAAGKIEQDQFDLIVASLQPKQSIAAALAQGGHVSQRDIGEAARRKVEQIIGSCCAQTTGTYEFEDGVLPKGALDLKLTTEKVLISAFEVLEPSGFLIRILKSPVAVLARSEAEPTEPELKSLRDALDGVSTLPDIGGAVGLSPAATEVRAAVLVVLGAASVVTSQIEEMSLPETGETDSALPSMSLSERGAEEIEAETIGFARGASSGLPAFSEDSIMAVPSSNEDLDPSSGSSLDLGSGVNISPASAPVSSGLTPTRASTQDLAAIKELIGRPASGPRPGSASIPAQRWEPMLSSAGRPNRERPEGAFQKPVVKGAIAALLIAGLGAVGWMVYSGNSSTARPTLPAPRPSPVLAPTTDPGVGTALPAPGTAATAEPVVPTTTAALSPAPSIPAGPTGQPSPAPTRPLETPTPPAMVRPIVAPSPTAATPSTSPAPPRTASSAQAASAAGYAALKAGRLAEAASAFTAVARSHASEFSVQLLVACAPQTIEKAIQNDSSPELYILPADINGKPCHRLMRGFFKTSAQASQAVPGLPAYYVAEGAKPRAVPVRTVLP